MISRFLLTRDPGGVSDADLLEWMGSDPLRWAQAFAKVAIDVEPDMPDGDFVGWLISWFANALQAGRR